MFDLAVFVPVLCCDGRWQHRHTALIARHRVPRAVTSSLSLHVRINVDSRFRAGGVHADGAHAACGVLRAAHVTSLLAIMQRMPCHAHGKARDNAQACLRNLHQARPRFMTCKLVRSVSGDQYFLLNLGSCGRDCASQQRWLHRAVAR